MDAKRWVSERMAGQDMAYSAGLYLWSVARISAAAQSLLYEWWERWREMRMSSSFEFELVLVTL